MTDLITKIQGITDKIFDEQSLEKNFSDLRLAFHEILSNDVAMTAELHVACCKCIQNEIIPMLNTIGTVKAKDYRFYFIGISEEIETKACFLY